MSLASALSTARRPVCGFALQGLALGSFAVQVPALKAALGVDDARFGVLLLCAGLGLVAALLLAPGLERRLQARALPLTYAAMGLSLPLPALAASGVMGLPPEIGFAAAMVLLGVTSGAADVLMNAQISVLEDRHRTPLMNAAHGMFSVAYALAALAAGGARAAGAAPGVTLAVAGAAIVLLAARGSDPGAVAGRARTPAAPLRMSTAGAILACGAIVGLAFMAEAAVESWSALHIERGLGAGPAAAALGPALLGLTMAAGRFGGHWVLERFGLQRMLLGGSALASLGAALVALSEAPALALAGFSAIGLGIAALAPAGLALAGRVAAPGRRTQAIAQVTTLGFAGFLLAPVVMGTVSDAYGLRVAFGVMGALVWLIPVAARFAARH